MANLRCQAFADNDSGSPLVPVTGVQNLNRCALASRECHSIPRNTHRAGARAGL